MSQPVDETQAIGATAAKGLHGILARFESAWKEALNGGPEPLIDSFVAELSDRDRPTLRSELQKLEQQYRHQWLLLQRSGSVATGDFSPGAMTNTPEPLPGATVEFSAAPPAGPTATIGVELGSDQDGSLGIEGIADADDKTRVEPAEQQAPTRSDQPVVAGYLILGELGRGGMGVVYKARQIKLNRVVALKMVLAGAHAGTEQLARFYTEAQAVAHLQHPNIVQIYEVSEQAGLPYFSLEYVDGGSLAQEAAGKPQPVEKAAGMVKLLAEAMRHAHQHGVIHRDLKPANVLLTTEGVPKITDFGLAKRLEGESSSQTRDGAILGTPSYMAPEQAMGEIHLIGPLTDVYSLGAILYELLTGRPPFVGPTPMDTVVQVTRDEPVAPSQLQPKIPRDLETICLKCLQKEQPKRYASAEALADDLRRFLAGEPILARPVSGPERLWRWCRRNPRVAALSAAVLLLLVAGVVGLGVANVRISHESEQAEIERKAAVKARDLARQKEQEAQDSAEAEKDARLVADQKTEEAREAKKLADQNAKVAGEQRKLALDTLYGLVTKVEEKLRDREDMSKLRQDIMETAMDGLGKVSRSAETAPLADRSTGVAHQRMGDIFELMSRSEETVRQYKLSLVIFDKLADEEPNNDWIPWNQAVSYDKLGSITREMEMDPSVALDYFRKSLELRERLAANIQTPEIPAPAREHALAVSHVKLTTLTQAMGDPTKALEHGRKALEHSAAALTAMPKSVAVKQSVSVSHLMLGRANLQLGNADASREHYEECRKLRQAILDDDSLSATASRELGIVNDALGDMELALGNRNAALDFYIKGHELHREMYQKDSGNALIQWNLGNSCYRLGTAHLLLSNAAESAKSFNESLELREKLATADPKNIQRRLELIVAQARCGQHREASEAAGELRERGSNNPAIVFSAGSTYALCVAAVANGKADSELNGDEQELQRRYAEAAIATLRQAIELGYKDDFALEHDPDLEPVRANPEFKKLTGSLDRP